MTIVENIIETRNLTRRYGDLVAVNRVNFSVRRGEIFGFLGPNGAGKTTTVRMLTGYLAPDEGGALLNGIDINSEPSAARRRTGVVPEDSNVYMDLTVRQNVMLMAQLHSIPRTRRKENARNLLVLFGLADREKQKGRALSKGFRQRLLLCMALVSEPEILFLDEPTSGLDVASARLIREVILKMNRERGVTIFLTTHNIAEAEMLCHRVAVINRGCIAAIDTPNALRSAIESRRSLEVVFEEPPEEIEFLNELSAGEELAISGKEVRIFSSRPGMLAQKIAGLADAEGLHIESIRTRAPSLEDVFLHITAAGKGGRENDCNEQAE